jgi:Arc/MetJ family transcription regulator
MPPLEVWFDWPYNVWYEYPYCRRDEKGMKITTNIDERLLAKAMRAMNAASQREALETGLRNLLADMERKTFVKEFNKFRLNWTPERLNRSRG